MKKQNRNSKNTRSSGPRKSGFAPAPESRFSKPSIKKSSLRPGAAPAKRNEDNRTDRPRRDYDNRPEGEKRFGKSGFGKPGFDKPGFGKSGYGKPGNDKPSFRKDRPERGGDTFKPKGEFRPRREEGSDRPARPFDRERNSGFRSEGGFKPRREGGFDKPGNDNPGFDRPRRPFNRDNNSQDERPRGDFKPRREGGFDKPGFDKPGFDKPRRPFNRDNNSQDERPRDDFKPRREGDFDGPRRPFNRDNNSQDERPRGDFKPRREGGFDKPGFDKSDSDKPRFGRSGSDKPRFDRQDQDRPSRRNSDEPSTEGLSRRVGRFDKAPRYDFSRYEDKPREKRKEGEGGEDLMRLNRYISNAGICSRREADDLIASGQISVNSKTITEMGYKVKPTDVVKYGKKALNPERMVYILLNKPKDYITTTEDPEDRKTVVDLIAGACQERVYPVGRLDRNTTGLLLLTNDGELAEKLTHPSSGVKKVYQAELDKPITNEDFEALQQGLELEDGFIKPDEVGIVTPDAMVVGLEIHSGRNRIVRRMFEHLGYEVKKLDRTVFAGLNKKDLPRGKWRFLTEKEVIRLKFLL
ncbi:pseudouridine synthase [Telluribacter sp. SYSU D00476]|uniref:pseudouridine synthase n=1 Tax=Telluribacter sp. SYSU D00476 TaxID=2811430 RepID=UPI001FF261CE|nr:pseudouridine synthase [Telluribacter sp. SYSU D00476]